MKFSHSLYTPIFIIIGIAVASEIIYRSKTKAFATTGCPPNTKGSSTGWFTEGAASSSGSGWTGSTRQQCDSKAQGQCCFCTNPSHCIAAGLPPKVPGSCRPDHGTKAYLGGTETYPITADFSLCPPGTAPTATTTSPKATPVPTVTTTSSPAVTTTSLSNITNLIKGHTGAILLIVGAIILIPMVSK